MATTFTPMLSVPFVTPSEIYATSIILSFLGTFFVLLRFYTRALQKKALKKKMTGFDDWLMLLALVCFPYSSTWESSLSEQYDLDSCHKHGNMSDHTSRFVVDMALKAILLTHWIGVQRKAIAYSTTSNEYLTPEEQFTYVNPTVKTMGMVTYSLKHEIFYRWHVLSRYNMPSSYFWF